MASNITTEGEKYEVLEKIGHGSFGIIRKVKRKSDGKILCRKEISYVRMAMKEREQLQMEFNILSSLRHPNIVGYYHRDHLKASQELHLYMEYCGGGDLAQYIKNLKDRNQFADEAFVWSVFSQLVCALHRCHHAKDAPEVGDNVMAPPPKKEAGLPRKDQIMILHRDLKPDNIFLGEDNMVKLGDFGLSKVMQSHDLASTYVGTPYYMSPEICAAEKYTSDSDIWSVGCIMYELCAKKPPFDAKTHWNLISKIKDGRYEPLPAIYSPELQVVIKNCLNTNPSRRPKTSDLVDLPIVRLMRKQKEVVDLSRALKFRDDEMTQKAQEAQELLANMEKDKENYKHKLEEQLRREWEVKARLEIDRQVVLEVERRIAVEVERRTAMEVKRQCVIEIESLQKRFDTEVGAAVAIRVQEELAKSQSLEPVSSTSHSAPEFSSQITNVTTNDSIHTDDTSYSFDSPLPVPSQAVPIKKSSRTPFSRARTQIDSPMDVNMTSPSPMSIASLSLSPRRASALAQGIPTSNLFGGPRARDAGRGGRDRWQPQLMEALDSDDEEEEREFLPDLSSPTRVPRAVCDPFKMPQRPGFQRQNTMPVKPHGVQSALFTAGDFGQKKAVGNTKSAIPTSPTRARPGRPFIKAHTTAGGEEMLKAVTQKNMMEGKTLVELAQAKAAAEHQAPPCDAEGNSWHEEDDEIPSPFLVRTRRPILHR